MQLNPKYYSYIPSNVSGILEEFVRIRLTVASTVSKHKNTKFRKLIKLGMKQGYVTYLNHMNKASQVAGALYHRISTQIYSRLTQLLQ